jgi:ribosomal protein S16
VSEQYQLDNDVTSHAVEDGAKITDHVRPLQDVGDDHGHHHRHAAGHR